MEPIDCINIGEKQIFAYNKMRQLIMVLERKIQNKEWFFKGKYKLARAYLEKARAIVLSLEQGDNDMLYKESQALLKIVRPRVTGMHGLLRVVGIFGAIDPSQAGKFFELERRIYQITEKVFEIAQIDVLEVLPISITSKPPPEPLMTYYSSGL